MYIYKCAQQIFLCVSYFQKIGELANFFQNHCGGMIFLKMAPNFTVLEGIFETQFQIWFFLVRVIFTGNYFVKLKAISILWWTYFFGPIHFKVNSDIKLKLIFSFWKFLDINMVYTLDIGVYIYKIYMCRTIFLWV